MWRCAILIIFFKKPALKIKKLVSNLVTTNIHNTGVTQFELGDYQCMQF